MDTRDMLDAKVTTSTLRVPAEGDNRSALDFVSGDFAEGFIEVWCRIRTRRLGRQEVKRLRDIYVFTGQLRVFQGEIQHYVEAFRR